MSNMDGFFDSLNPINIIHNVTDSLTKVSEKLTNVIPIRGSVKKLINKVNTIALEMPDPISKTNSRLSFGMTVEAFNAQQAITSKIYDTLPKPMQKLADNVNNIGGSMINGIIQLQLQLADDLAKFLAQNAPIFYLIIKIAATVVASMFFYGWGKLVADQVVKYVMSKPEVSYSPGYGESKYNPGNQGMGQMNAQTSQVLGQIANASGVKTLDVDIGGQIYSMPATPASIEASVVGGLEYTRRAVKSGDLPIDSGIEIVDNLTKMIDDAIARGIQTPTIGDTRSALQLAKSSFQQGKIPNEYAPKTAAAGIPTWAVLAGAAALGLFLMRDE